MADTTSLMANNFTAAKTIRDFLATNLANAAGIEITLDSTLTSVNNVDVIWDGSNYYLSYSIGSNPAITIVDLDSVLPIVITPASTATT